MFGKLKSWAIAGTAAIAVATPALAQDRAFDPGEPCGAMLRSADDTDKLLVAAWALGYLSGQGQDAQTVDFRNSTLLLRELFADCIQDESLSLTALVERQIGGVAGTGAAPAQQQGTRESAEALLQQFYDPGADLVQLTAQLVPTPEEVAQVYAEPLASNLSAMYAAAFTPGMKFSPKPEHNALLIVHTTTGALKSGDPVLDEFPGGYSQVLQYIKADVPIVRFKFITEGETLGLAFDGLVFVNGHWVLMPKPWRAL